MNFKEVRSKEVAATKFNYIYYVNGKKKWFSGIWKD